MSEAEVHLWRASLDEEGWPGPERLPPPERERAAGFLRAEVRERWVASRWALRGVLARYLGEEPAAIELAEGEHGKPRLARDPSRLRFNLSHSGRLALVAICREREVGVDVEEIAGRGNLVALAERALAAEDVAAVRAADEDERAAVFHDRWARHEARLKCLGVGLGGPAREMPVTVTSLRPGDGYAAAVAVEGSEQPSLREWTFGPPRQGDEWRVS